MIRLLTVGRINWPCEHVAPTSPAHVKGAIGKVIETIGLRLIEIAA